MNIILQEVIKQLTSKAKPFRQISSFSDQPGIYALFFTGDKFPFDKYLPKRNEILYIGKTESSQQSRDANTHFASGKTGSSTIRRSFGALLLNTLKLVPLPRSQADIIEKRITLYKFDNDSEERLTTWMKNNLGLSFYPYPQSVEAIDILETQLIQQLVPILNIDRKNPANTYAIDIMALRKHVGLIAYEENALSDRIESKTTYFPKDINSNLKTKGSMKYHIYEEIWEKLRDKIIECIKKGGQYSLTLPSEPFDKVGDRQTYRFNLEYKNGEVSNDIGGSAVARDLARVLEEKASFYEAIKGKEVKINMDAHFTLFVKIL